MSAQRGFLLAGPMLYAAIGAGVIIVGLSVALKVQSSRLETCRVEFGAFKMETKRIGEAAEKARIAEEAERKEIDDAKEKAVVKRITDARARWLRDSDSGRDKAARIPQTPTICNDPADNQRLSDALERFRTGTRGLLEQAEVQTAQLIELQAWAQEQSGVR